ncbi:HNH endonuclease signature motif containing protein [Embleya scabrispora]|uniref:HNH endonuclease signature motif containing protein n=1 Tax=Embleya scabrispora TaxID=159449 RepID=UPI00036973E8|nr:HNH endonuclease signature motif containing protein [Embleya scabrispora]MYS87882.1 hypothetical protein [Streptomyces sp. SID5474]
MAEITERESDGIRRKRPEGPSYIEGWDVVYPKPVDDADVIRLRGQVPAEYALACRRHKTHHRVGSSIIDERVLRRGPREKWCQDCARDSGIGSEVTVTPAAEAVADRYRRLCAEVKAAELEKGRRVVERTVTEPYRDPKAIEAVLDRCGGRCENPQCRGMPDDLTLQGLPILEVDHIEDLALGGRDYPENMIALCPNCHAMKTRGRQQEEMRKRLRKVAEEAHRTAIGGST